MTAAAGSSDPDGTLDAAIVAAVVAAGGRGVPLAELWQAVHGVEPELAWAVDRRARLADALGRLSAAGAVAYSTTRSAQDRDGFPPLPKRIRDAKRSPAVSTRARAVVPTTWRPELAAAQQLERPRPDELEVLHAVNQWLRDRADDEPVRPLRERSWQIFGSEKRLDSVVRQRLFRDGILSLELLRAVVVHPPFVHTRVASAGAAFICENHQTYHSAAAVLSEDPRGFAVVGYGAGRQFQAAVSYVEDLRIEGQVLYFGDLDADGLAIAGAAAREAADLRLVPIVPATTLYELLLAQERTATTKPVGPAAALELVQWLAPVQRDRVVELLVSGRRVPQEAVGARELAALTRWT